MRQSSCSVCLRRACMTARPWPAIVARVKAGASCRAAGFGGGIQATWRRGLGEGLSGQAERRSEDPAAHACRVSPVELTARGGRGRYRWRRTVAPERYVGAACPVIAFSARV